MFRHGNSLYLIGRTDPSGHFMNNNIFLDLLPDWLHHLLDLGYYSLKNHGNAIWKVDKEKADLEQVLDIPGCGDTSFASIIRLAKNKYLVANYSSPKD
jgi:predicted DNA-binding helix-hairpin-helix protein